jgi:hypothetical protein
MEGFEGAVEELETGLDSSSGDKGSPQRVQGNDSEGAEGGRQSVQDDPYSSKTSREYSQFLKGLRDSGDPAAAKWARLAKDNHGEMFALRQLEKQGLNGVREKYAVLDSVIHNDPERGELHGAEAIAALQDSVREMAEVDELLAQGDPRALEALGEDFNEGLAKLAPSILDRVRDSDPEAYAAAVLPHFVQALASSELVSNFNGLVDVLNQAPPQWLTAEQKTAWAGDQQQKVIALAGNMGKWLNAQAVNAAKLAKPGEGGDKTGTRRTSGKDSLSDREAQFNKREQETHWNTNIAPKLDQHASTKFSELFRPYAKRLNLDAPTANALKLEFSKRVAQTAVKDPAFIGQIKRYRGMRNPDPATVLNFTKVNFDKHARTVMESLVNERYKPFLTGRPRTTETSSTAGRGAPPPAKGVQIVTQKPANIDYKRTTVDMIHAKTYWTTDGKRVQVRS